MTTHAPPDLTMLAMPFGMLWQRGILNNRVNLHETTCPQCGGGNQQGGGAANREREAVARALQQEGGALAPIALGPALDMREMLRRL